MAARRGVLVLALLLAVALAAAGWAWWLSTRPGEFGVAQREGPPALVQHGGEASVWLMVQLEERHSFAGQRYGTRYHLELRSYDSRSGTRQWSRRLRSIGEHEGGHGARGRILGQQGDAVWLFVADQPVLVAAADGALRGTGLDIAAKNPALAAQLVGELDHHLFDDGLVILAADARRYRIALPGFAAQAWQPASDEALRRLQFMASGWNGAYRSSEFLIPAARMPSGWLGLYTAAEAAEAGRDEFGSQLADPWRAWRDDTSARRSLYSATIGRTRAFSEGAHDRLVEPTRLPASPEFLQGGFLRTAGQRQPLVIEGSSLLVLHRTRTDAAGRLQLTRLLQEEPASARVQWQAALPFGELHNRWQLPDRLVMVGSTESGPAGRTQHTEQLAIVELASGRVRAWNLTLDMLLQVR
ncbi:PA2928 family protein [Aquabacterium sp.]|uniref:PA2928 family protein n=1 Tax=Aquabacterium sp. TaxID=1872578 RepID=UPI0037842FA9